MNEITDYILNNPEKSYAQMSEEIKELFGVKKSVDAVRKLSRKYGNPPKRITSQTKTKWNAFIPSFKKFLSKGRTLKEIEAKYGKSADMLLDHLYEDYILLEQLNEHKEKLYILLPHFDNNLKILPRNWKYHVGISEEGIEQPYILINLPNFKGNLEIALLFDVHYGHSAHRHDKFLSYIKWIKDTPNVYAIIGGDLMENAIDDGRGMTYDQDKNPSTQLNDMMRLLAPIAHKILFATPGNHEERTFKKTGIDVMKVMAERLNVPYFSGAVIASLVANGHKWTMYAFHGHGNSQTKGGKMNMASKARKFTGTVHFFVSGHVHDRVCESETSIIEDPVNCRLNYLQQWTVIAPSFLGWENTYAYRAGYPPPAHGGVAIELDADGGYRARLT